MHGSDTLRMWVGQKPLEGFGLFERITPVERFWLVIDSSTIQRDLRYLLRNIDRSGFAELRTAIMETIDSGIVVGVVPPTAIEEIEKYLPSIAADAGRELSTLEPIWATYRRRLTVVEPMRTHHHADLEKRDPKDMPFVAVLRETGGDALLTADRDLLDTIDAAITAVELMSLLREYARQKAVAVGASGQLYVGAWALGHGGSLVVRTAGSVLSAVKALPPWAQIALAIGAVWVATRPATKAWISKRLDGAARAVEFAFPLIAETVSDAVKAEKASAAVHTVVRGRLRRLKRIGLRAALLRASSDESTGVQVAELARRLLAMGYQTTSRRFTEYLERCLARDPMFERTAKGWRLVSTPV